jgi:pimeloyl-ACP methyl ester carboxylesterase
MIFRYLLLGTLFVSCTATAVEIYAEFPGDINPQDRYVIYSHGLIVEGDDPSPTHPSFEPYEFPEIKTALFDGGGFNLIAHHRPANTDADGYVMVLESWVRRLIEAGVSPQRITLVGFSRGGYLTGMASSRLKDVGLNTALMAACVGGRLGGGPPLPFSGNVLSIYETSDQALSCDGLATDDSPISFDEVAISTGRRHGAFFVPLMEWLDPLRDWIRRTNH